jgi:2-dehydro-3-deoxyphosphogluconate aldolase/(4S)-4-hydroxy-2-oxoglutarate aldolase
VIDLVALLGRHRLLPVLVLDDAAAAASIGAALVEAGLPVAEVTLRTPEALAAIERMAAVPGVVVGAGTVVSPDQVDAVAAVGARFVVSPGLHLPVVQRCADLGLPCLPGVATPSEVMAAMAAGIDAVKLFPAHLLGGAAAVQALSLPFPGMQFVPTGGVDADALPGYLSLPSVLAVGGSWMVPRELVRDGAFGQIRSTVAAATEMTTKMTRTR